MPSNQYTPRVVRHGSDRSTVRPRPAVSAMRVPSGDHDTGPATGPGRVVTNTGSVASISATATWGAPVLMVMNAMWCPSGDQMGVWSPGCAPGNGRGSPPAGSSSTICCTSSVEPSGMRVVVTATHEPSGATSAPTG